jgi:hypothetical protein
MHTCIVSEILEYNEAVCSFKSCDTVENVYSIAVIAVVRNTPTLFACAIACPLSTAHSVVQHSTIICHYACMIHYLCMWLCEL